MPLKDILVLLNTYASLNEKLQEVLIFCELDSALRCRFTASLDISRSHTIAFDVESISKRRMTNLNSSPQNYKNLSQVFSSKNCLYVVYFCLYRGENTEHFVAVLQTP